MSVQVLTEVIKQINKYLKIQNLVTKRRYEKRGNKAWFDFHTETLIALSSILSCGKFKITVNNWSEGGQLQNCGLRDTPSTGAEFSGHLLGYCLDLHCSNLNELYDYCEKNWESLGITELENKALTIKNNSGWVHISTRPTGADKLVIIG